MKKERVRPRKHENPQTLNPKSPAGFSALHIVANAGLAMSASFLARIVNIHKPKNKLDKRGNYSGSYNL